MAAAEAACRRAYTAGLGAVILGLLVCAPWVSWDAAWARANALHRNAALWAVIPPDLFVPVLVDSRARVAGDGGGAHPAAGC